jgi:hypothetical protein
MSHKALAKTTFSLEHSFSVAASGSWDLRLALFELGSSHIAVRFILAIHLSPLCAYQSTAMVVTQFTAVGTASAVLALSKAAWKLGSSLSKLEQDTKIIDTEIKDLAGEVKSLGNECDLIYAELEEVVSKSEVGSHQPYGIDDKMWICLAMQVEETSRTMQELESFVKSFRVEESSSIGQIERQRKVDQSKDQIANIRTNIYRQTGNLRTTLLLINT